MTFRQGPMSFRTQCNSCHGEGKRITSPCETCRGSGIETKKAREELKIPKGVEDGTNFKLRGKGHMNGDLLIKVSVRKHPQIKREGMDAHTQNEISVTDAVLGCELRVKTIYNEWKVVKVKAGVQSGEQVKLEKEGFYRVNSNLKGNHIVTIKVKVPKEISEEERAQRVCQ